MKRVKGLSVLYIAGCIAISANCWSAVDRAEIDRWIDETPLLDAPAAGTVLTAKDIEQLKPWIPPGLIDELQFPEFSMTIQGYKAQNPHKNYTTATLLFEGQSSLGDDGRLNGYTAGQPFSNKQIEASDERRAGYMVAWNNIHRWQYFGYQVDELTMAYIGAEAGPSPLAPEEGLMGGGQLDRLLSQSYHRVYLNHLAMLSDQQYKVKVNDSATRFFKDYIEFLAPFNVKGTKFVVERMLDPVADDQVNTYLPTERRIRRFSAKERADSFMGSEATLDDFDGFSGRVMDYKWRYLGEKKILSIADTIQPRLVVYGPRSRAAKDEWQLRDCHVVEVVSTWEGHPYKSRVLFLDKETYGVAISLIFRHDNTLWKTMQTIFRGPKNEDNIELSVPSWRGQINIDRYSNTSTIVRTKTETRHPTMKVKEIKRIFNVSSLTEGQ